MIWGKEIYPLTGALCDRILFERSPNGNHLREHFTKRPKQRYDSVPSASQKGSVHTKVVETNRRGDSKLESLAKKPYGI